MNDTNDSIQEIFNLFTMTKAKVKRSDNRNTIISKTTINKTS